MSTDKLFLETTSLLKEEKDLEDTFRRISELRVKI